MLIIDLRSDTLTMPTQEMLRSVFNYRFGDSGRLDENNRGGDPTVNELEDYAAAITGMERAIFLPSGTMGNHVAMLTHCYANDVAIMDSCQHLYRTEKATCDKRFGQIRPVFYHLTKNGYPDIDEIKNLLQTHQAKVLCLENTHNCAGGTCIPLHVLKEIHTLAKTAGVPIHMDGARLFNAAIALQVDPREICKYADTVMFCLSKGLGAPIGSVLCSTSAFAAKAVETRKLLGGNMRQAGVVAAYGIYALKHNIQDLKEDHRRTKIAQEALKRSLTKVRVADNVQTNILILNIEGLGVTAEEYIERAKNMGVWLSKSTDTHIRMVFYRDIDDIQLYQAVEILEKLDETL